jgi:tetratricopeptide (TPR) repeat protein
MPLLDTHSETRPAADEERSALDGLSASDELRGSPQLVAFLRYVVERTLRGEQDRIKGYTIAVEALGRGDEFDPLDDPIVRVEATRLRRAIHRYYDNGGKYDAVQIELPLGSYVPVFRRGRVAPAAIVQVPERRARRLNWRYVALVLFGAGLYGSLDFVFDFNTPAPHSASFLAAQSRAATGVRADSIYPVVYAAPFATDGGTKAEVDALRGKLRDALARFDAVQIVVEEPTSRAHYRLSGSAEYDAAGLNVLAARLVDVADGTVAYSRTFSRDRDNGIAGADAMVHEMSAALAQPYGIIQSRERNKDYAAKGGETQYHCLLEAYDYWRSYDPQQHLRARECLERVTEANPGFALGHAALATILIEEYRGVNARADASPPLQRALIAARRAVELKPASARAHQALSDVQFARGDYPLAVEAAERAIALNPDDPDIEADYGGMLVSLGDLDRGARMIRHAAGALAVRPMWHDFLLFLTDYLTGDQTGAARYAALMTSDDYPPALVARAVAAAQGGDPGAARRLLDRIATLRPGWRKNCGAELAKYVPAEAIVKRIEREVAMIDAVPGQ